jgi:transposase
MRLMLFFDGRYVLAFFQKLPPCLVGIEACASSHHWSRELQSLGHTVRLMPPAYVKPYVKRQKNDAADAEAICEAVTRANMRFVATKTPEQQSCLMLYRTRHLFIRQQTAVINVIRAHLAEFGIVAPVGRKGVEELLDVVADSNDDLSLPKTRFVCTGDAILPRLHVRRCPRSARSGARPAHPFRAKHEDATHCNRRRISQGSAAGALR